MEHTVVAATTTVGIALLFVLCLLWRRLLVDIFRDRLFRLREQWFDLALDSESTIQFDSHLYRSVKHSLCTMLRTSLVFALLTAIRFVSLSLRRRPTPER